MSQEQSYYDVLGVSREATPEEIRRAYIRMVRRHPPERDKEGFQRVQQAYEVLRDEKARREYDQQWFDDPVSRELLGRAKELLEEGKEEVLPLLKRLLVRNPGSAVVRDMLTRALQQQGELREALESARRTVSLDPESAVYRFRLADVLEDLDREEDAIRAAREALERDPEHVPSTLLLARCLQKTGRHREAVAVLRRAIEADGVVDFNDFVFFRSLCHTYVAEEDWEALDRTREEIRRIVPPDPETRSFVAWSFFVDAMGLAKVGRFVAAKRFIEDAAEIDPSLPQVEEMRARIGEAADVLEQAERLREDERFLPVVRMALSFAAVSSVLGPDEQMMALGLQILPVFLDYVGAEGFPWEEQRALLSANYPAVAANVKELLADCDKRARRSFKEKIYLVCPHCGHGAVGDRPQPLASLFSTVTYTCPHCHGKVTPEGRPVEGGRPARTVWRPVPRPARPAAPSRKQGLLSVPEKVVLGIVLLVVLGAVLDQLTDRRGRTSPSPVHHAASAPSPSAGSSLSGSVQVPPPKPASRSPEYTRPPVGWDHVHGRAEIRWCLRQKIRLETMRDLVADEAGVTEFNRLVDDYNRRCGRYRYYEEDMNRARADVEAQRPLIERKARRDAPSLGK